MILLGTVLLEPNRWKNRDQPQILASEWIARAAIAGFDGIELWENHWLRADAAERKAICASALPIKVFNTYARFDRPEEADAITSSLANLQAVRASALKFNVGPPPGDPTCAGENLARTARALPAQTGLRCECHQGTWLEDPEDASRFFKSLPVPVEIIVHAFALQPADLRRWFAAFGAAVTAIHVQCRDDEGRWSGIARHPERSRETLQVLSDSGFRGDFTLEFTAGTAGDTDTPEQLWSSALDDLLWLGANWVGAADSRDSPPPAPAQAP